jgi:hypothetical protein
MCPARALGDAGQLLGTAVNELVPPEAQAHLLNAQREMLLALSLTLEHHLRHVRAQEAGQRRRPAKVEIE